MVGELLLRAGCKRILLIDDDIVRVENLNRIHFASHDDVSAKTPKVDAAAREIHARKLGCVVEAMRGSVLDDDVLLRLRECDVIFGCVDKAYPRKLLSELAYRYVIPYLDVGTEIGGDAAGIASIDARTSYVAPGRPCMMCMGVASSRQLAFESKTADERARQVALGYSDDLMMTQPAVMDLNMRAASLGVLWLRHLLQPFLLAPMPLAIYENIITSSIRRITSPKSAHPRCRTCLSNPRFGWGDAGPQIGLRGEDLRRVLR